MEKITAPSMYVFQYTEPSTILQRDRHISIFVEWNSHVSSLFTIILLAIFPMRLFQPKCVSYHIIKQYFYRTPIPQGYLHLNFQDHLFCLFYFRARRPFSESNSLKLKQKGERQKKKKVFSRLSCSGKKNIREEKNTQGIELLYI